MEIAISFDDPEFQLRYLIEVVEGHAKDVFIDGDRRELIVVDPDEYLLEELENRGIKYRRVD